MIKIFLFLPRLTIVSFLSLVMFACATVEYPIRVYSGDKRPEAEIVQFQIPSSLEALKVDGIEIETSYVTDDYYLLEVLPGNHTLELEYVEQWGDPTSSVPATSEPFRFELKTRAGEYYEFRHNGPEDLLAAESALVSDVNIWLELPQTGLTINAVAGPAIEPAIQVIAAQNVTTQQNPKPEVTQHDVSQQTVTSTLSAEQIITQQDELERLRYWWGQADEKQRDAFVSKSEIAEIDQPKSTAVVDALKRLNFWWKLASDQQRKEFTAWVESQK